MASSPPRPFLLIVAVMMSSLSTTSSTSLPPTVTLPSATLKSMSVVTLKPFGAASSWRVYVPSSGYTRVGAVPLFHTSVSPAAFTSSPSAATAMDSEVNVTFVTPSGLTPVSLRVAPFISVPPMSVFFIGTLTFFLGLSSTCILLVPSALISEPPVVTASGVPLISPFSTVNVNLDSTFSKPSGAAVSSRVYSPSGRFLMLLEAVPDVQLMESLSVERSASPV